MSWEQVTRWTLRCDGDVPFGQCDMVLTFPDTEDGGREITVYYDARVINAWDRRTLHDRGWLVLPDDRLLCPDHVDGRVNLAAAEVDGLPLSDTP